MATLSREYSPCPCQNEDDSELYRLYLERVLASSSFSRSTQLQRLLRWLGEGALSGYPLAPTERLIAEIVLNRTNFDPQADSLVRKEMSRLREKLVRYYVGEGARDRVRISSPGGYRLGFEICPGPVESERSAERTATPRLLLLPFRTSGLAQEISNLFLEETLIRLSEQMEVVPPVRALSYVGCIGDPRDFARECDSQFVVDGRILNLETGIQATLWLIDGQTGRVGPAKKLEADNLDHVSQQVVSWLSGAVHLR